MKKISGFNGTINDVKRVWKNYAINWKTRSSPWRPSTGDIDIYKKLIKQNKGKILILGATPEIRSMDILDNFTVTLIDISSDMLTSMSKLVPAQKVNKEVQIISDWCDMPFPDSSFDIVLSDCPWWLFSIMNQRKLSNEIFRILKPNGYMICRLHFCDKNLINKSQNDIIEKVLATSTSSIDRNNIGLIKEQLMLSLLDSTTNNKTQRFTTALAIKAVKDKLKGTINNKTHETLLNSLLSSLRGRLDWTSQTEEQIFMILENNFIIEDKIQAKDYNDSKTFPIVKLRKKLVGSKRK